MIPEFLRRENREVSQEDEKMMDAIERYEKHFGEGLNTEPSSWSDEEWCKIIEICINKNQKLDDLLGIKDDPDDDD